MAGETKCNPCDATGIGAVTAHNYTDGTPYNPTNSLAENSVRFQDILNPLYAQGRVLETWGQYEEFLRYETIFFDVVPQKDPTTGEIYVTYKFKNNLASSGELTLLDSQCKVGWYEPRICGDETEITDVNGAVITVASLAKLGGVNKDSTILVMQKDGNPVNGLYIQSVNSATNEITLKKASDSVHVGDKVRR
jgi:hypothetical protein